MIRGSSFQQAFHVPYMPGPGLNLGYRLITASAFNCLTWVSRALVLRNVWGFHSASTFICEEVIE